MRWVSEGANEQVSEGGGMEGVEGAGTDQITALDRLDFLPKYM